MKVQEGGTSISDQGFERFIILTGLVPIRQRIEDSNIPRLNKGNKRASVRVLVPREKH